MFVNVIRQQLMRTVVIDEGFKTRLLRTIAQRKPVEVGALLGRQLPDGSRDFLTLAVALPLPQGKKRIKNEKQGEQEDQKEEGVAWRSLADVSGQTVEAHVKRVKREGKREGGRMGGKEEKREDRQMYANHRHKLHICIAIQVGVRYEI